MKDDIGVENVISHYFFKEIGLKGLMILTKRFVRMIIDRYPLKHSFTHCFMENFRDHNCNLFDSILEKNV